MGIEDYFVPIVRDARANICWDCENACGGCSWTEIDPSTGHPRFKPVDGWTAKPVKINLGSFGRYNKKRMPDTYHITACPQFIRTPDREVPDDGCET